MERTRMNMDVNTLLSAQHQFFRTGTTRPLAFRIEQLKKLKSLLQQHEADIAAALKQDLHKATTESVLTEILLVTTEIDFIVKRLKKWMRSKKVPTPLFLWPARSEIHFEPYGSVLIIAPWNYPFVLMMSPLIGAMSAGNCAVIKPSEIATFTEKFIAKLINEHFSSEYLAAVTGGPETVNQLLQARFDYIFFTGGCSTGKHIMKAAAEQLMPVTLELGGKSPCIVDETADLDFAARRIAWAKTLNAGQVCIAPDYLYVHRSRVDAFIQKLRHAFIQFYGEDPKHSPDYGRIINPKHFERLMKLMQHGRIIFGGQTDVDSLYIAPTVIDGITWQDPIMQEEIFGPLLPILTYDSLNEVLDVIQAHPKPLAFYFFSRDETSKQKMLAQLSFGGGCINDCVVHISNPNLPFGGVGMSGMGAYHGQYSFETFSHRKSVYRKNICFESKLEYPPYKRSKLWWLKKLLVVFS